MTKIKDEKDLNMMSRNLAVSFVKQDLNIRQFHSELILFSEDNRHKNAEMSVIIVMSHGKEGFIQCSDNLWVRKS